MVGAIMGMMGSLIGAGIQASNENQLAGEQGKKAQQFSKEAGNVVAKKVTDDPAFILKQYLANNGMPGLQQYLETIDENEANQIAIGKKSASSGGQLMSFIAGLQGNADASKRKLYTDNASYTAAQQSNLADTQYAWQTNYDTLARIERAKLNKVASQYQAAADLNRSDADRIVASMFGSIGSSLGTTLDGMKDIGTQGGGVTMGAGMGDNPFGFGQYGM